MSTKTIAAPENADKLAELRLVLHDVLTEKGIDQWLVAKHRLLDGATAIDLIEQGGIDEVLAVAHSLAEGAYI